MAFTTNPYCTLQQVYSALDLQAASQTSDGPWLQELIEEAQSAIDMELGFSFQTDGTIGSPANRIYDGTDRETLWVPLERILSITQVLETTYNTYLSSQGVYVSGTTQTVDITADVFLGPPNFGAYGYFVLKRKTVGNVFTQGNLNYSVFGVFGRPSIPPDITRACVRTVAHYYQMRNTAYADMVQETGGVRQHYMKDLPRDVMQIIQRYKPRLFLA